MNSIYNTITEQREDEFDFIEYLKKAGAYDAFSSVFEYYDDIIMAIKMVKFIAFAYTPDSELLPEKASTWEKVAKHIFNVVDIPSEFYDDVVNLKNEAVREAAHEWLRFQNDDNWTNYVTFRDLRFQMIKHSLSDVKKGEEVDIKSKMDAAKYAKELLEMMDATKNNFVQASPKIKSSVEALQNAKVKDTIGPQHFAK